MADVSKVNVNSTNYDIKDSNAMHKGVDRVTAGQSIIAPIGTASTADGFAVNASGDYSHASGLHTIASSDIQHVIGKYNEEDANGTYAFIVGGGRLDVDRKNIFTIDWNGDVNAGRSNGLTNDTKLPTGADVVSYLNSNFVKGSNTWKKHSATISVIANNRSFVGNFPLEIVSVACTDSRLIPYFAYTGTTIQIYIYNPTSAAISTDVYYR